MQRIPSNQGGGPVTARHRLLGGLAMVAALGCQPAGPGVAPGASPAPSAVATATTPATPAKTATPAASLPPAPDGERLTGYWGFIGRGEARPSPGPELTCFWGTFLRLAQQGSQVTGRLVECPGPCYPSYDVRGTYEGGRLLLTGKESDVTATYDLRYDAATAQLVGTRDGKPFAAVALRVRPKAECEGQPAPQYGDLLHDGAP